ncbi:Flagellar biosynthetic protein FliR [Sphingomonas antarctica]|uniref:flagellar biosynthetic protein FliR n=1 Tax=Sphingomonas antarctica TaxID=2040274 RepID=UPI0039E7331D
MIPTSLTQLQPMLLTLMLAMLRPGAALLAAPIFGASAIPVQVRVILALAVGVPASSAAHFDGSMDAILSVGGIVMMMGEVVLGLALGFALQIGFAVALIAGESIGSAMGLGFASMNDPASGHSSTAIGQFLNLLAGVLFLCSGGHLALIEIVMGSFRSLPPGVSWLTPQALHGLADFGGLMFAAGATVALPVVSVLILVQIAMAVVTRAAPALNLFAVGIPVTVLAGLGLMALAVPVLAMAIEHALDLGLDQARVIAGL